MGSQTYPPEDVIRTFNIDLKAKGDEPIIGLGRAVNATEDRITPRGKYS
jgi:hypothetical protein